MFSGKTGVLAVLTAAVLLFGGCGKDGTMTEDEAKTWYNEMTKGDGGTNTVADDGTGIVTGGPDWGAENGTQRDTYGMRNDGTDGDTTLGEDIRNAWDDVTGDDGGKTDAVQKDNHK